MASKITITFADDVAPGTIDFQLRYLDLIAGPSQQETFYVASPPRSSSLFIIIPPPSIPAGNSSAAEYAYYWNLDHNIGNYCEVTVVGNVVTIEIRDSYYQSHVFTWADFSSDDPNVTAVINNIGTTAFTIDNIIYSNAIVPCTHVEASIETSEVIPEIWLNGIQIEAANVNNPYILELVRGIPNILKFVNANGFFLYHIGVNTPVLFEVLGVGNITYDVFPSVNGATLKINYTQNISANPQSVLEYSLNDIDWQSSNIFTGQGTGVGTLYIRDEWGCKISKPYEITDAGSRKPYLVISKANAIPFSEYQEWDDCSIFKNDENTLAYQGLEEIKYCENILFNLCDDTKIHMKSNYDTPSVTLRYEDSTEVNIPLIKHSSNLNRYKQMDCIYYKYAEGLLGIYFDAGNTYDELSIINGAYTLNGNLPEFAINGQYININGLGVFKIDDIIFDSSINKRVIIVEYVYNGAPTASKIESIYDLLPFEVYEFILDWELYGEGLYDVLINNTDTYNGTVQHISENIYIKEKHENTVSILYWNNNNRDVFYKYGIKHFIRVPYLHIERTIIDDTKINIGDLTVSVTESKLNEGVKFHFDECIGSIMLRNSIALSCENLFINGQGFVKNDKPDIENIYNTNLYTIIAELIKTNINYNNNRQGQEGIDEGTIEFNIPAFVFGDNGFVKS